MKKTYLAIIAAVLPLAAHAQYEFGFTKLYESEDDIPATPTNDFAHAIGEDQFRMVLDIDNPTNGTAIFNFYNIGDAASVISSVRMDEGSGFGLTLDVIGNTPDLVYFETMPDPNNPPAKGDITPAIDADIGVEASPIGSYTLYDSAVLNGPSYETAEKLTLEMSYTPGHNILDMLTSGELRVVTKLQGVWYPGDDMGDPTTELSEYFVNDTGYVVIPEPSSVLLLSFGALGIIGIKRKLNI